MENLYETYNLFLLVFRLLVITFSVGLIWFAVLAIRRSVCGGCYFEYLSLIAGILLAISSVLSIAGTLFYWNHLLNRSFLLVLRLGVLFLLFSQFGILHRRING
jgi:hypothetical protein